MLIRNKNGPPINTLNLLFSSNTDDIDMQNVIKTEMLTMQMLIKTLKLIIIICQ